MCLHLIGFDEVLEQAWDKYPVFYGYQGSKEAGVIINLIIINYQIIMRKEFNIRLWKVKRCELAFGFGAFCVSQEMVSFSLLNKIFSYLFFLFKSNINFKICFFILKSNKFKPSLLPSSPCCPTWSSSRKFTWMLQTGLELLRLPRKSSSTPLRWCHK